MGTESGRYEEVRKYSSTCNTGVGDKGRGRVAEVQTYFGVELETECFDEFDEARHASEST